MSKRLLLSLEDIYMTMGSRLLFQGVNLHIAEGDKVCLIGRNGAGKTTLMRLIMQEMETDSGKRFVFPGITIGYLAQTVNFKPQQTVRDFVREGLHRETDTAEELSYRADKVLQPLSLDPEAIMSHLSGGQLRRAALAQALVDEPDILLLDEPTNHLDLEAIQWLEQFLARSKSAVICVSHDRTFLSNFTSKVFWIEQGRVRIAPSGYAEFDEWAAGILEQEARTLHNMGRKLENELDWTQGGVTARRKRNQRRMNELHRLREKLRVDKAAFVAKTKTIDIDPLKETPSSKIVAEFKHVTKRFERDGKKIPILNDFSLRILKGDRIGILGRNGSGKSTFLKLLMGELESDSGFIHRSKKIELAYFDQHRIALDPQKTLWHTLAPNGDYVYIGGDLKKPRHVAGYLKSFMFDPKRARDDVGTLSGGMQNRLMLARVLINPGNLMILDEPTNDLDMDTLDMLQDILAAYTGTLIIVSHDRDFLDRTVTEVMAFEGDGMIENHIGGYSDYLAAKTGKRSGKSLSKSASSENVEAPSQPLPPVAPRKPQNPKLTFKEQHALKTLPDRITFLETEIKTLSAVLEDPGLYSREPEKFDKALRLLTQNQKEVEQAMAQWERLEEKAALVGQ
ncbi:MAG: ABC-F family ATP-binding cassette domain-containing protein [Rickettsiales bacterium]